MVSVFGTEGGIEGFWCNGPVDGIGAEATGECHLLICESERFGFRVGKGDGVDIITELKFSPSCTVAEVDGLWVIGIW